MRFWRLAPKSARWGQLAPPFEYLPVRERPDGAPSGRALPTELWPSSPFDGEHQAVNAAADSQQRDFVTGLYRALFHGQCQRSGKRG
jgi:hypothetical protein